MKVILIGHGMVAATHVAAISESPGLELMGVLGRDVTRTSSFVREHCDSARIFTNIEEVLDAKPDFVILITPPNAREEFIRPLAAARIPVLMEKPVERSLDQAKHIIDLCASTGTHAGVVLQHRVRAASLKLKELVEIGSIGRLVAAEIRVPWWRPQSYYDQPGRGTYSRDGGGVMINQAIHTLDLATWLLGPVARLQAHLVTTEMHKMESEDWASALLEFQNGAVGTMTSTVSFYPGGAESLTIQGTAANAHLENGVLSVGYIDGRTESIGETARGTGGGADPMAFTHAWHQAVIEDFAKSIETARAPICTAREALNVHAVIDAMERASKSRSSVEVDKI